MRTLFFSFFIFYSIFSYAGKKPEIAIPFDSTSNRYTYSEVVEIKGYGADSLYLNSKNWLLEKYLDSDYTLDERNTKIIDQGSFSITSTMNAGMGIKMPFPYTINFNLILEFKEGKYRYFITNIKLSQNAEGTTSEQSIETFISSYEEMGMGKKNMLKFIEGTCEIIDKEFGNLIIEMKKGIEGISKANHDEW